MLYILLMLVQIMGGNTDAAVLNVNPADSMSYQTIAAALDSCRMFDTLILAAGTHHVDEVWPRNPLTIMGIPEGDSLPHITGKMIVFRDDVRLQNLVFEAMSIAIEGLQAIVTNCVFDSAGIWCELSDNIKILNNEFINSGQIFCYLVEPEIAFNTFRGDSLHGQGIAIQYIYYPNNTLNIHHNSFFNYRNVVELDWPCRPFCKGNYTIDLSDNWWGVTDTAAILALSGESEIGDMGDATVHYRMNTFLDAPPGSLGYVPDSAYGVSYNTFEDVEHAVVVGTFDAGIEDDPRLSGNDHNADQYGETVYLSIDGRVVADRARLGKGVYIEVQGNTMKKVLLLK